MRNIIEANRATARLVMVIVCVIVTAAAACAGPVPQTITLRQGHNGYAGCADSWLWEYDHDDNNGNDTDLHVRHNSGSPYDRNSVIRFNLAGQLPTGACIKFAKLKVYQTSDFGMGSGEWLKVGAYRLLKDWTEGTGADGSGVSWAYRHANQTYPWFALGARGVNSATNADRNRSKYPATPPYVGVADSVVTCTTGARWLEFDVTPSVHYWVANPSKNYGIILDKWLEGTYTNDDVCGIILRSKEYTGDWALRPTLEITYVVPTSEPDVNLKRSDMQLNTWTTDPGISFSENSGQLVCSGTTTDSIWGMNGCATTYSLNSSFEARIRVKLQQGIVGVNNGEFGFGMWEPGTQKYIRILAVGFSAQYYEISGICAAVGNGENHDGAAYWASYWDVDMPTYPPSCPGVRFFGETPENEATTYMIWKLRYDKSNKMFYVFVNDVLVTYYSNVDFSNWKLAIVHDNNVPNVPTTVWIDFPDTNPPSPNPMTWASQPAAVSTSSISMIATTATDLENPPCSYYFTEVTGNPGGTSSGWVSNTSYTDSGLSANTQYGYKVKARDSYSTPNETADSTTVYKYTLIPAPTGVAISNVQATSVGLTATGALPNMHLGQSATRFETTGGEWSGSWKANTTSDTASGLTPNTQYTFRAKARNGDAVETAWSADTATVRTLAAQPGALPYGPVTCQGIQANWSANGNPAGTQYYCEELTTGRISGWITNTSWVLTGLRTATNYRFRVKARNANGVETGWTDLGEVTTKMSIGYIKMNFAPPMSVLLDEKVVTAVFERGRLFFLQDNRGFGLVEGLAGIGVVTDRPSSLIQPGLVVTIRGRLEKNKSPYDKELVVQSIDLPVLPLIGQTYVVGCNNLFSGGGVFGSQPGLVDDASTDPAKESSGLNMVGMLVRVWGRFEEGGRGGVGYFWVDDGSQLSDGSAPGIRVDLTPVGGIYPPPFPQYVAVTGIMRCMMVDSPTGPQNVRVIWPTSIDTVLQ